MQRPHSVFAFVIRHYEGYVVLGSSLAHHLDVDAFPPKNLEDLCTHTHQIFSQCNLNMHTGRD